MTPINSSVETGRVEKGEKSSQKFTEVDMDFENHYIASTIIQILPESRKPAEVKNAKVNIELPNGDWTKKQIEEAMKAEFDLSDILNKYDGIPVNEYCKKDIEDNKNDHGAVLTKMDDVFSKLTDLESKLAEMDQVVAKIDQLGAEVKEMKPETPQEKLEMRSLDSYPFNQKPNDFFSQKQQEMKASGKNEYVLTKDEVESYSPDEMKHSFNPQEEEEENEFKF